MAAEEAAVAEVVAAAWEPASVLVLVWARVLVLVWARVPVSGSAWVPAAEAQVPVWVLASVQEPALVSALAQAQGMAWALVLVSVWATEMGTVGAGH